MNENKLILFSREGCCLCKNLEQKLQSISLQHLTPPLELLIIDIDNSDITKDQRTYYDLKVPVLVFKSFKENIELPRASPRLDTESLFNWLQKVLSKIVESA